MTFVTGCANPKAVNILIRGGTDHVVLLVFSLQLYQGVDRIHSRILCKRPREMLDIKKEIYVSMALNRAERVPRVIASSSGGVEIESVPEDKIFKTLVDPLIGYSDYIS